MTTPLRPRVADPVLLVMMELARRPGVAAAQFNRDIDRVCKLRREAHVAMKKLRRALKLAKDSLGECCEQVQWLDGFSNDGISVDDVLRCVKEFRDCSNKELVEKLTDTIDPNLLAFVRREAPYSCPLCGERHERRVAG